MRVTSRVVRLSTLAFAVAAVATLSACGKKREATQAAARVDGAEITVHQINYRLQRERGLRPEQMDAASRKTLDQLIDVQLVVEKAEKEKIDKQPAAQQAMDAARRDVLARAYVEQVAQSIPLPAEDALHRYFDANDALFTRRRIYTVQEFVAQVPEDKIPALKSLVDAGRPVGEITAWFKDQNVPFRGQQSVHPAEQVPLNVLKNLAAVQDGHGLIGSTGNQVHVTYVVSSVTQPVAYDQAKPAIMQFLVADARRKATQSMLAALKTAAKIDYAPQYAALAASGPALGTIKDIDATAQITATNGEHVSLPDTGAASGVQVALPSAPTANVQVTLPASTAPSSRVSLPTAASSVEVRLPPQTGDTSHK